MIAARGAARRIAAFCAALALVLSTEAAFAQGKPGGSAVTAKRARALFDEGIALSDEGKWPDALTAFQRSDELVPSASVRFNIGATLRALGRYVEAKDTLQRILDEGDTFKPPLKPALRKDIEALLAEVKAKIVVLSVRASPASGELQVDGSPARPLPDGRIELDPGKHVFTLSAAGHDTSTVTKTLSKDDAELAITAPPTKVIEVKVEEKTPLYKKGWFWATTGAVVAGAAVVVLVIALQPGATDAKPPPMGTVDRVIPAAVRF